MLKIAATGATVRTLAAGFAALLTLALLAARGKTVSAASSAVSEEVITSAELGAAVLSKEFSAALLLSDNWVYVLLTAAVLPFLAHPAQKARQRLSKAERVTVTVCFFINALQ